MRGDPCERRRFLDELIVARSPRMAGVRADYDRVLKQRAALLKSAGAARAVGGAGDLRTLDVWDGHLANHGAQLLAARLDAVARAASRTRPRPTPQVAPASAPLAPALRHARWATRCRSWRGPAADSLEPARGGAAGRAGPGAAGRARAGVNLVGPHRDDLELALGELPVRGYASHGESWSAALALRLGSYELLRADEGADPVLILDDVFAELDVEPARAAGAGRGQGRAGADHGRGGLRCARALSGARFDVHDGQVRRVR